MVQVGLGRAGALGEGNLQIQEKIFRSVCNIKEGARDHDSAHMEAENDSMAEPKTTKSRGVPSGQKYCSVYIGGKHA